MATKFSVKQQIAFWMKIGRIFLTKSKVQYSMHFHSSHNRCWIICFRITTIRNYLSKLRCKFQLYYLLWMLIYFKNSPRFIVCIMNVKFNNNNKEFEKKFTLWSWTIFTFSHWFWIILKYSRKLEFQLNRNMGVRNLIANKIFSWHIAL